MRVRTYAHSNSEQALHMEEVQAVRERERERTEGVMEAYKEREREREIK